MNAAPTRTDRHPAYAAPSSAPPFALPPPDAAPLTGPTRAALLWDGPAWFEVDPRSGRVIETGTMDTSKRGTTP
jgi:hypothetical protein